jgi:hypothetical protein
VLSRFANSGAVVVYACESGNVRLDVRFVSSCAVPESRRERQTRREPGRFRCRKLAKDLRNGHLVSEEGRPPQVSEQRFGAWVDVPSEVLDCAIIAEVGKTSAG